MNKIPTAKEFLKDRVYVTQDNSEDVHDSLSTVADAMIEYAKLRVKAALEAAADKAKLSQQVSTWNCEPRGVQPEIDKQSILNAYPSSLIQ